MKFFTAERFIRIQQRTGREEALRDWERASNRYAHRIQKILPDLPKELRSFLQAGSLHDANLLAAWLERGGVLRLILASQDDSGQIIDLNYRLAEPPQTTMVLPEQYRSSATTWLYDEIDLERLSSATSSSLYRHRILLSNGCQVSLRFHRLVYRRYPSLDDVLPHPSKMKRASRSA